MGRIYYFDDSGSRVPREGAPFFVLGGFGIDMDDVPELKERVQKAAERYGFKLEHPSELKFQHVGTLKDNGKHPHWMIRAGLTDRNQRRALVYSCLREAMSIQSVSALCVAVNTERLRDGESAIGSALIPLLERVEFNCQRMNTQGLVVMDEERRDDKALRQGLRDGSSYFKFARVLDTIAFMPSEESPGVQVADLVAGAFSRYLNSGDAGYLRTFLRAVDGYPEWVRGRGLKVLHRADRVRLPEHREAPWGETDRLVHDYEMDALGVSAENRWSGNGSPTHRFEFDSDTFH